MLIQQDIGQIIFHVGLCFFACMAVAFLAGCLAALLVEFVDLLIDLL